MKVKMLNFIHHNLHHDTVRNVPVYSKTDNKDIEIYHRTTYMDSSLDVCVYFPPREEGGFKQCIALVKLTSDNLDTSESAVIDGDAAWTAEAKADKFTLKNDKIKANYWVPRWKVCFPPSRYLFKANIVYQNVVNILRTMMYEGYERNGVKKPEPEVVPGGDDEPDAGPDNSPEDGEEKFTVFAGCSGKIIGPKGAKIQELKRLSGVKDIKMPAKDEDAPRPRARDPAEITLIGKVRAIAKAKVLIQEIVDEWVCPNHFLSSLFLLPLSMAHPLYHRFLSLSTLFGFVLYNWHNANNHLSQTNAPRPPRDGGYQTQNDTPYGGGDAFGGGDGAGGSEEVPEMAGNWGGGDAGGGEAVAEGGGDTGAW
jgi:hypothetical protein